MPNEAHMVADALEIVENYLIPSDLELEHKIELASTRFVKERSIESWNELVALVKQRSPQQVSRMEGRMGIG